MIWYPIQRAVDVEGEKVPMRPFPSAASVVARRAQGV
jgi:hypothetical protein